jgi:hypothetical protein
MTRPCIDLYLLALLLFRLAIREENVVFAHVVLFARVNQLSPRDSTRVHNRGTIWPSEVDSALKMEVDPVRDVVPRIKLASRSTITDVRCASSVGLSHVFDRTEFSSF